MEGYPDFCGRVSIIQHSNVTLRVMKTFAIPQIKGKMYCAITNELSELFLTQFIKKRLEQTAVINL